MRLEHHNLHSTQLRGPLASNCIKLTAHSKALNSRVISRVIALLFFAIRPCANYNRIRYPNRGVSCDRKVCRGDSLNRFAPLDVRKGRKSRGIRNTEDALQ